MSVFDNISLPKVIYEADSQYNGHIQVIEAGSTRRIVVDKVTQSLNWDAPSAEKRYWGKVVEVIRANEPNPHNVLILGLGGATLQHKISRAFTNVHIVSIDIDQTMIDIAKKYFNVDDIPNHQIIKDDACRFIVEHERYGFPSNSFSVVIVDIYVGEQFPDLGNSGNFIAALKNLTKPGGLIIFNRIYTEHHQDDVNHFIDNLEEFLTDIKSIIIAGHTNSDNVLIYGRSY